jgi:putative ABC transport system permease protein
MFRNYLKTSLRNLWRNKTSTGINLLGLTTGLTCCLLIGLYMQHELSYDNFQTKGERTARVIMEYTIGSDTKKGNFTSTKVAPTFQRNFPEIESAIRMQQYSRVVQYGDKLFDEKRFLYADSTFFDIFSFKLLQGKPQQVLMYPKMVVLTSSAAKKYFGNESPVGKIIKVGSNGENYQVTGVMEDCPSNSQLKFDFLASFSTLGANQEVTYGDANYTTFLLLKDKNSFAPLQKKITAFIKKETKGGGSFKLNFILEHFDKIHLYSEHDGFEPNNNITYIYIIAAVAMLILAIACFTYINLSTARSVERAKEVGIRKVVGALKGQIFGQFVGESVLLSLTSLVLSIGAVWLALPAFNELTDRQLSIASLLSPFVIVFTLITLVCISLLAGSYPALVLSAFKPIKVLKGSFKNTGSGLWLRKSLIVFQFVISVFLIVGTFIIQSQLHYIQSKKLGYNRDHVLVMPMDTKMLENLSAIKTGFAANSNVRSVTRVVHSPTNILGGYNMSQPEMPEGTETLVTANPVDEDFVKTMGLQIIAGTDLNRQDIIDVSYDEQDKKTYHYILNESAARELGWTPEQAVGKKMFLGFHRPGYVRGVVKDFHFSSLHSPIKPLVLFPEIRGRLLLTKISGNNIAATISHLENAWKKLVPHRPFEYSFLDEEYNKLYSAELRIGKVLNIFAGIAILLACLGLFGLSSYAAQQRMKEIGIRKVLGASVQHIVTILSKDFIRLALIATLIAFPFAWWMGNKWLQDFTYRVEVSWWVFAIAGSLAVLIALLTVSIQAIKAAISNPVKSLRSE